MTQTVSVIGGGGHVGLGMSLVLANNGSFVYGIENDASKIDLINDGQMPFHEADGDQYLQQALEHQQLRMTDDPSVVADSDVVIVVIGTPIDENFNPVMAPLRDVTMSIVDHVQKHQLIVLRSTVSPGTTDMIRRLLEEKTGWTVGTDFDLVFAPERVAQGKAIREMQSLPQIIGAFDNSGYERAASFFQSFLDAECIPLSPLEAEIGKLITNMTRYVNFALANEYHLIGDTFGVNMNKIIDACNRDYPRLNLPSPGPNVGGPCLYKDGWFLIERIPYNELISTAFQINEGMPMQIAQKISDLPQVKKVTILGMTFKANSDDIRNSVSFKLKKQLETLGYRLTLVEPHLDGYDDLAEIAGSDAVVLMTPHDEFRDLCAIQDCVDNPDCLYVDIWGFWDAMRYRSDNGYFWGKETVE
ncbi:MAG: nucleotide sugar dehydrogenase [Salinibacter sp.]